MKNFIKTTLLLLALLLPATAAAYDFEVDGLYYNITGVNTVEVTYRVMYEADTMVMWSSLLLSPTTARPTLSPLSAKGRSSNAAVWGV